MTAARVALITGGTDGIGKASAARLLADGWDVAITARSTARGQAVAAELTAATGRAPTVLGADLSVMREVREAARAFRAAHGRLDALVLNANAITQARVVTEDGFESNLAIGYLGRVLLLRELEDVLAATAGAQVLTVVGLDHQRIDFDDPQLARSYTARAALMRWQWAMQLFVREHQRRGGVPMNVFMPGLVRTKILASEPQPMRLFVQILNAVIGLPVERSAAEVATVLEDVRAHARRDTYFSRTRAKPPRNLGERSGDAERLWELTERLLAPHRGA